MKSLVVGGAGAFGRVLIRDLKKKGFNPICVDFSKNDEAAHNLIVDGAIPLREQRQRILSEVADRLGDQQLGGIFCSAGGWAGGSAGDDNFLDSLFQMNAMNLESAALTAHIAAKHVSKSGLVVFTGAEASLRPTPSMLSYGLSKVSTHFLVKSVAIDPSFVARKASVLAILPCTIDTPTNRKYMAEADHSTWTSPEEISKKCMGYLDDVASRPLSGSLLAVYTDGGVNTWKNIQ